MIKTDLWDMVERERKAREYLEECAIRRTEKIINVLFVIGGIVLLSLILFNI